MAETLKLRNELVHEWMRKRAMLQGTSENRLAMIEELRSAIGKLENAERAIREGTRTMMAKVEVPEEFVRNEHQRLMELTERGEEDSNAPDYFSKKQNG